MIRKLNAMMKKLFTMMFCLGFLVSLTSCETYAYAATPDGDTVIVSTDDVYATAATTAILLDYVWAWNGSAYYRYYCTPYYAVRPYYWHGPRHYAPRHWRGLPHARPHHNYGHRPHRPNVWHRPNIGHRPNGGSHRHSGVINSHSHHRPSGGFHGGGHHHSGGRR